jgi:hypothetical protein
MIDHFVLLTPFVVLPILLLFAFVGCALKTNGLDLETSLIVHPDVLSARLIKSFTVTFSIKSGSSFFTDQVQKTAIGWSKTDSVDEVTIPWDKVSPPSDNGPFTVSCDVTVVDNNDHSTALPTAVRTNLGPEDIFQSFELLPSDDNTLGTFAVQ